MSKESKLQPMKVELSIDNNVAKGVYANHLVVGHTANEFFLDFFSIAGPQGSHTARVFTSPGHMKRIINAIQDNLVRYENSFGKIKEAPEPSEGPANGYIAEN